MIVKTGRFGELEISDEEIIAIPNGVLGFPGNHKFCLVDPGDDTLILWLQSLENPNLVFPVLEPKIFKSDYVVRLSASELRELALSSIKFASVFTILTIPQDLQAMTANLKAPLVINTKERIAKQVVLQENDQPIQFPMFKELRAHLMQISSLKKANEVAPSKSTISVSTLPGSDLVRTIS